MIIKSKDRSGAFNLANHLISTAENERVTVLGGRHLIDDTDIHAALMDMHLIHLGGLASGGKCRNHLHHVMMNPSDNLNAEQWAESWGLYEAEFGLEDQPYIEVEHFKEGRAHRHRVYHRIREHAPAIEFSQSYPRNEYIERVLEHKFGHDLTIGAHNRAVIGRLRKDGQDLVADWMQQGLADKVKRPIAAMTHAEHQIAKRTGQDIAEIKGLIRDAWAASDSGQGMEAALIDKGLILARGNRADFVIVDATGQPHSMAKQIDDNKAAIKSRMEDLDPATLPSVDHACVVQMEISRLSDQSSGRENDLMTAKEVKAFTAAAWQDFESAEGFQKNLADKGLLFAQGKRGILIVDQSGKSYNLAKIVPDKAKDVRKKMADIDVQSLPSLDNAIAAQKSPPEPSKDIPALEPRENQIDAPDAPKTPPIDQPDFDGIDEAKAARDKRRRKQAAAEARKRRDIEADKALMEQQRQQLKDEIERGQEHHKAGLLARARAAFMDQVRMFNRVIDKVKSVFKKDDRLAPDRDHVEKPKHSPPDEKPSAKQKRPKYKVIDLDDPDLEKDWKVKPRDRGDRGGRDDR